jgi:hypothetical protein
VKILSCKSRRQNSLGLHEWHASSMPTVNSNHYFEASISVRMAYKQTFFKLGHLKAVTVNITVFWNVTPCSLLDKYTLLEEPNSLSALRMGESCFFETLALRTRTHGVKSQTIVI